MSWLWEDRLVEVWASPGRAGAGVLFGMSGVLTARHVVDEALGEVGRIEARVVRRNAPPSPWTPMRVVAEDPAWDLAVLLADPSMRRTSEWAVPETLSPVVASVGTAAVPGCEAVGFPDEAVHSVDPDRPGQTVRQTDQVRGTLLPMGQAKAPVTATHRLPRQWMPLDVDTTTPAVQAGWKGMSGAGVVLPDGRLAGLVVAAEAARSQRRLYVVPLGTALTTSPVLTGALTKVVGAPIEIGPASFVLDRTVDRAEPVVRTREPDRRGTAMTNPALLATADRLAELVAAQWLAERQHRGLSGRVLPVAWGPADPGLFDDWPLLVDLATGGGVGWPLPPMHASNVHRGQPGWAANALELSGTGNELIRTLGQVPTSRLVVLGEPGAGKTVLLIRLVADLLAQRVSGEPVPVLVPLASWNPAEQDLNWWLESRLKLDYPFLARPARDDHRRTFAGALIDAGLILPVLDGLDEIPDRVRGPAIDKLRTTARPGQRFVLSSRSQQYREAVRPERDSEVRLTGAAGVELRPLEASVVRRFLLDSAEGPRGVARWEPVLAALDRDPAPPVALALTTPLMVTLAHVIYNPRPGERSGTLPNPRELLWFSTRRQVEHHLFDGFVPAAYRPPPDRNRRDRWRPENAQRWLVFLARHLEHNLWGTPDLAWWELPAALGGRWRWVPKAGAGLAAWAALSLLTPIPVLLVTLFMFGIQAALVSVPAVAVMFAGVGVSFGWFAALVWAIRAPAASIRWRPLPDGLPLGRWVACVVGLIGGLVFGSQKGLLAGLAAGLLAGLALAIPAGFRVVPVDLKAATNPPTSILRDRRAFWSLAAAYVLSATVAVTLGSIGNVPADAVLAGSFLVFAFAPGVGLLAGLYQTAWSSFSLARAWLAFRRRLPARLMAFLADAHRRGVLRQAGPVYRFRHLELQRRLATAERSDDSEPAPPVSPNPQFDRFTDRVRLSIFAVRETARTLGQHQVGTAHLLLGLVRDHQGAAARVLAASGIQPDAVRRAIHELAARDTEMERGSFQLTTAARKVLRAAADEAGRTPDDAIDSDHLLLQLIKDRDCTAARVLQRLNADVDRIRDETVRLREGDTNAQSAHERSSLQDRAVLSLVGLGDLLAGHGDLAAARLAYRQAIDSGHPDQAPMAVVSLGQLLEARGDLVGARTAYHRAIDSDHPDQAVLGMLNLGALLHSQGYLDHALRVYGWATRNDNPDLVAVAKVSIGSVWAAQGYLADAQQAYRDAVGGEHLTALVEEIARRLGPDDRQTLNARFLLARLTGEAGDHERARDQFSALVEDGRRLFGPDNGGTRESEANLRLWAGKPEKISPARYLGFAFVAAMTLARGSDSWVGFGASLWVERPAGRDSELDRDLCAERVQYLTQLYGSDGHETLLARTDLVELTLRTGDPQRARELAVDLADGLIGLLHRTRQGREFARTELTDALAKVSTILDSVGRPTEALAAAQETVRLYRDLSRTDPNEFLPSLAASLHNISSIFASLDQLDEGLAAAAEAVETYRQLAESDPAYRSDLADALTRRGLTLSDQRRWDQALADLSEAVEINPIDAYAIGGRAEVYRSMDRLTEALTDFSKAIELDPQDTWAIASRGQTHRAMRSYSEALNDLNHAIELDPTLSWAFAERGETRRLIGHFEEALADFNQALELETDNAWIYGHRGRTYRDMGLIQQAEDDFGRARALDPTPDWVDPDPSRTIGEV